MSLSTYFLCIAAMLRESVVVRTRPRAIPLAMITMRKSFMDFLYFPMMTMGLRLAALRPPELRYNSVSYDLVKTSLSELQAEAEAVDSGPCDWLVLSFLLPTPTISFSLNHKRRSRKRNRKKSGDVLILPTPIPSSFMTPLTTLIFDFH